jgi:hypothetical protein
LAANLQNAVTVTLDIVAIRSRYIQDNLRRALTAGDRLMAWVTAAEFRRYFHWFADTFPEPDKRIITQQLSKLEELYAIHREPRNRVSTHADRVGHQFQESAFT